MAGSKEAKLAQTDTPAPVFGTDEWGVWATGVQARIDELTKAANGASADGLAEKIAGLVQRLEAVEAQQTKYDDFLESISKQGNDVYAKVEKLDALGKQIDGAKIGERLDALENAAHKNGKSVAGDDVGARIAALETMLGLHPEHVTAEAEAHEDETEAPASE